MTNNHINCTVSECSFNHDGCAAPAITVGGSGCSTFISLGVVGGLSKPASTVGACQRNDCKFNDHLMCSATDVVIGKTVDVADCQTYVAA